VIPLIEDLPYILNCDKIVESNLSDKFVEYQRVFLAKSDLALNYGMVASTLALKIALMKLEELKEKLSIPIYPIVGFGSAPFRGNLRPDTVDRILDEWRVVQTFTIQSAFKYDYPEREVVNAIEKINNSRRKRREGIDVEKAMEIIRKTSDEYRKLISALVSLINRIANYVLKRRERKLHIGLFGYSRTLNGSTLPRAIPFCCALYSIGLPPEIIGLNCLSENELDFVMEICGEDITDALQFFNPNVLNILPNEVAKRLIVDRIDYEINEEHKEVTDEIIRNLDKLDEEKIVRAAYVRRFLG